MKTKMLLFIAILSITFLSCDNSNKQLDKINSTISEIKADLKSYKNCIPRFQMVQSTIAAKGTYKLDTYDGDVYQLVVNKNNEVLWEKLNRFGHTLNDTKINNERNYEIFLSTIAMKFTFIINVNTGATWQLVQDPTTKEVFFSAIE